MSAVSGLSSPTHFQHQQQQHRNSVDIQTSSHFQTSSYSQTSSLSPSSFSNRFQTENAPRPPVNYQSPISPIRTQKCSGGTKKFENHFVGSPLSRTSSLPILPGALRAVQIEVKQMKFRYWDLPLPRKSFNQISYCMSLQQETLVYFLSHIMVCIIYFIAMYF
jgi:hypothetical protein